MINDRKLYIYNNDNDLTRILSVLKGDVSVLISPTSSLYIGFRKPLYNLFMEVSEGNVNINDELKIEKWNGTAWVEAENNDKTFAFYKSGHIKIEQLLDNNENLLEKETTINNKKMYFIKISSESSISIKLQYLNVVFGSQELMLAIEPRLDDEDFFPSGYNSYLPCLVSATNQIISEVNVSGELKYNGKKVSNVNQFDFHDLTDIETSATYFAISQAFVNIKDSATGNWGDLAEFYYKKYKSSFRTWGASKLTIDKNDDGKITNAEINDSIQRITFIK